MPHYRTTEAGELYFVTLTVVGWLDIFTRYDYKLEITRNLEFCAAAKDLEIYAYCLMSNHIHLIAACQHRSLNEVLREFKSFTGKKLLSMMDTNQQESRKAWLANLTRFLAHLNGRDTKRQFWQRDNYPVRLMTRKVIEQKRSYIHLNPVRAGIVAAPEHYLFSSACPDSPLKVLEL